MNNQVIKSRAAGGSKRLRLRFLQSCVVGPRPRCRCVLWSLASGSATTDANAVVAANPVADQSEDSSSDSRENVRLVPSSSESPASEEDGSSGDESFEPDSEGADSDLESLTAERAASSEQDEEEDISNYLIDGDLKKTSSCDFDHQC
ncbi:hypothetical protein GQ600_15669 [Phytophthora cactorum]|nr:hypothetical protein GQ600_15669 [Phytophthora cactorum]